MMKRHIITGFYKNPSDVELGPDWEETRIKLLASNNTLKYGIDDLTKTLHQMGIIPSGLGLDLLILAILVYLADTRVLRCVDSQDSWTREFCLVVPVSDVGKWQSCTKVLEKTLKFLTGDIWTLKFVQRDISEDQLPNYFDENINKEEFDVVTLFSGGMDSLISTINFLEEGKRPLLIRHAGDTFTSSIQSKVMNSLNEKYKLIAFKDLYYWLVFNKDIISSESSENTTRSRSFLFIGLGVYAISGMQDTKELMVPENGLIALNVPLDNLRLGSFSTKTTHPYYLSMWNTILEMIGFDIRIKNEYSNKTKGEMALECKNKQLLKEILPISMSCSSANKSQRAGLGKKQHCGFCVPCIIRRAAIHIFIGLENDPTNYSIPEISKLIDNRNYEQGRQLRSFQVAIERIKNNPDIAQYLIHKSGPLEADANYLNDIKKMYIKGLLEVSKFIDDALGIEGNFENETI